MMPPAQIGYPTPDQQYKTPPPSQPRQPALLESRLATLYEAVQACHSIVNLRLNSSLDHVRTIASTGITSEKPAELGGTYESQLDQIVEAAHRLRDSLSSTATRMGDLF